MGEQREIAWLKGLRRTLLAPRAFAVKRIVVLLLWSAWLTQIGNILLFHREGIGRGFFAETAGWVVVLGPSLWVTWFKPPTQGDR